MARIASVPARDAGPRARLVYWFTRRNFARLTGREPPRMLEPLEIYAHVPALLRGYARLEQATARLHRLDWRLQVLAELKATTIIGCEFCIDLASQIAQRSGLSDQRHHAASARAVTVRLLGMCVSPAFPNQTRPAGWAACRCVPRQRRAGRWQVGVDLGSVTGRGFSSVMVVMGPCCTLAIRPAARTSPAGGRGARGAGFRPR